MTPSKPRSVTPSDYLKVPLQTRSTKTLERIIAACMELLDEKGFKLASMTEIASRAGVSVATLYTRFKDKETLLDYLFSYLQSTRYDAARAQFDSERWIDIPLGNRIDHLIGHLVSGAAEHAGLFRALSHRQLLEERTPVEIAFEEEVSTMLVEWLQGGARTSSRELADEPARMAVSLITSAVRMQIVFGINCGLSREELVDQLSTAVHSYLGTVCTEMTGDPGDVDG
jgi:AcrR family transcriptional regulator